MVRWPFPTKAMSGSSFRAVLASAVSQIPATARSQEFTGLWGKGGPQDVLGHLVAPQAFGVKLAKKRMTHSRHPLPVPGKTQIMEPVLGLLGAEGDSQMMPLLGGQKLETLDVCI